jgi:hypothetical protein
MNHGSLHPKLVEEGKKRRRNTLAAAADPIGIGIEP